MADSPPSSPSQQRRPILLLSQDVFLLPRLQDAAAALGFHLVVLGGLASSQLAAAPPDDERMLTEPLHGPDAGFIRQIAEIQPALILLDLGDPSLPALHWLQRLKTSAATRRMPVLAFGPHVEAARLNQARQLGAEAVVPRSRLQSGLADLIRTHALPEMSDAIRSGCDRPLSSPAERGLDLMCRGAYFEAHEAFEEAWLKSDPAQHGLYRALVQTCVTYLHLQRGNRPGAAKLLLRIHQWLDPLPDRCSGLDVAAWKADLQALRAAMDAAGDDASATIDPRLLRPLRRFKS